MKAHRGVAEEDSADLELFCSIEKLPQETVYQNCYSKTMYWKMQPSIDDSLAKTLYHAKILHNE